MPLPGRLACCQTDACDLQLLGELLLDRANSKVMLKYVADPMNLMMMMILLKDNSRSIQFEAFHVFKVRRLSRVAAMLGQHEQIKTRDLSCVLQVFVANPNKPDAIVEILTSNKDKLLKYLGDFHTDKGEPVRIRDAVVASAMLPCIVTLSPPCVSLLLS